MKANELRIGNLIIEGNEIKECDANDIELQSNFDIFEPIQLTEEWLLKFGFEKSNIDSNYNYIDLGDKLKYIFCNFTPNLSVGIALSNDEHHDEGDLILKIKYVHQLQNLYFALTNKELTLEKSNI